ncbi:MAG TPA: ribonuclease P protein component [Vicinamibacterales bacterium]|nr:ribonuclease P protein component [Vicinamibacterales bacterium]
MAARTPAVACDRRLRPSERLRRRREFEQARREGLQVRGRHLTLVLRPNGLEHARLGIVASRRLGGAVRRNRAKRLVRELFRHNKTATAAGLDIVVVAHPTLLDAGFAAIEADYRSALARGTRALRRETGNSPPHGDEGTSGGPVGAR